LPSLQDQAGRVSTVLPSVAALHDRIGARPRIAAYLKSPRRIAFNEQGIFRHYVELDVASEPPPQSEEARRCGVNPRVIQDLRRASFRRVRRWLRRRKIATVRIASTGEALQRLRAAILGHVSSTFAGRQSLTKEGEP
jgi:hypothetical protein